MHTCTLTPRKEELLQHFIQHDAHHLRHFRWFWKQRTSQFKRLCSNTTICKWSLSQLVFELAEKGCQILLFFLFVKTGTGLHYIEVFI